MTLNIPNSLFDKYYEAVDWLLSSDFTSRTCRLVYSPIMSECANCTTTMLGDTSTNAYRHGGPAPFSFGSCPMCGGNGLRETESSETIRLRIYLNKKDWKKIADIAIPDAEAMVIGKNSDLQKFQKANEVIILDGDNTAVYRFSKASEPLPHGFGKNRYFVAFLSRA